MLVVVVDWWFWVERQPATVSDGSLVHSVGSSLRLVRPEEDSVGVEEDSPQSQSHRHQPRPTWTTRAGDTCRMWRLPHPQPHAQLHVHPHSSHHHHSSHHPHTHTTITYMYTNHIHPHIALFVSHPHRCPHLYSNPHPHLVSYSSSSNVLVILI